MEHDSHAFISFALVGLGIFLVDSGIRGRKPIATLTDIIRNPSDIRGTLAQHNSDIASPASELGNIGPYNAPTSIGSAPGPHKSLGSGAVSLGNYTGNNGVDPGAPEVLVHDNYGHTIQVNQSVADRFVKFLNDLQGEGYVVHDVGGYRRGSLIAGTNTRDMHSYGLAIDINPSENPVVYNTPRGTPAKTDLPANVEELATADGLVWGGSPRWSKKDPMHFSVPLPGYSY